jgi:pre-mRNA-processing factor SLU7
VHMNANPTQGELLHKEFQDKKEQLRDTSKVSILAKYGGAEHLEKVPKELLTGQTENCMSCTALWAILYLLSSSLSYVADVEYSRTGAVIKGQERAKAKSKYDEDGEFFSPIEILLQPY